MKIINVIILLIAVAALSVTITLIIRPQRIIYVTTPPPSNVSAPSDVRPPDVVPPAQDGSQFIGEWVRIGDTDEMKISKTNEPYKFSVWSKGYYARGPIEETVTAVYSESTLTTSRAAVLSINSDGNLVEDIQVKKYFWRRK